jgi:hypothetical protein
MNKELIQQFLNRACYDEQDQRELEDWINVEKFTELIVRECANLCQGEWDGSADTHDSYEAYNECAYMIRKHFGVE